MVGAYRLIGYENRLLKARDFNDDTKDAGEMGAGHSVTALYEIVPPGEDVNGGGVDPLKYQRPASPADRDGAVPSNELMTVKVRYKKPDGDTSTLVTVAGRRPQPTVARSTSASRPPSPSSACCCATRRSRPTPPGRTSSSSRPTHRGDDPDGYRAEFVRLVELAASLDRQTRLDRLTSRPLKCQLPSDVQGCEMALVGDAARSANHQGYKAQKAPSKLERRSGGSGLLVPGRGSQGRRLQIQAAADPFYNAACIWIRP